MSDEQRLYDIELAVIELARVTEQLVCKVTDKRVGITERQGLLHAIDNVRALCTPETDDDDPDDDPPAAGVVFPDIAPHVADWLAPGHVACVAGNGVPVVYAVGAGFGRRVFGPASAPEYIQYDEAA